MKTENTKEENGGDAPGTENTTHHRSATANWLGGLKDGKGALGTESGVLENVPYSFHARFDEGTKGTNPEELLAAAHAGCFTMSVAAALTKRGLDPTSLYTKATITLKGLAITNAHLSVTGFVNGMTAEEFESIANDSAHTCVMSKALSVPVTCESHFTK